MNHRATALACLVLAAGTVSCIELSVDPDSLAAIEFPAPTNPSVVAGDTLRDTLGAVERLRVRAFGGDGDEIADAQATFVGTDTFATIVDGNILVGRPGVRGTAKVYAIVGGLQSLVRNIEVIPRPDSIAPDGESVDTVRYIPPTTGTATDSSAKVSFVVRAGASTVNAVRVKLEIERDGVVLAPGDTGTYALVGPLGRVSAVDTTDGSGIVSRTLRVRTVAGTVIRDTIVVRANATIGGAPLKGAPARVTIVVIPAS